MSEYLKTVVDCSTGIVETIPLTAEEVADLEASIAEFEAQQAATEAERAAKQAARESAIAKLAALGLSEEEAAAIVGV